MLANYEVHAAEQRAKKAAERERLNAFDKSSTRPRGIKGPRLPVPGTGCLRHELLPGSDAMVAVQQVAMSTSSTATRMPCLAMSAWSKADWRATGQEQLVGLSGVPWPLRLATGRALEMTMPFSIPLEDQVCRVEPPSDPGASRTLIR